MELLGIGPLELMFILLIALVLIGPKDMAKTGRTIGRTLRKVVTSNEWRMITQTSREIRNLPTRLIREAGLEDVERDVAGLKQTTSEIQNTLRESTILPPSWQGVSDTMTPQTIVKNEDLSESQETGVAAKQPEPSSQQSVATQGKDELNAWISPPTNTEQSDNSSSKQMINISTWITPPRTAISKQPSTKSK